MYFKKKLQIVILSRENLTYQFSDFFLRLLVQL